MQKYFGTCKTLRRSIRMLSTDPAKTGIAKSQNINILKSRLAPLQLRKVEFIADKIFELSPLELAYVDKKIHEDRDFSKKFGMISFDRFKAAKIKGGKFKRNKHRIRC